MENQNIVSIVEQYHAMEKKLKLLKKHPLSSLLVLLSYLRDWTMPYDGRGGTISSSEVREDARKYKSA